AGDGARARQAGGEGGEGHLEGGGGPPRVLVPHAGRPNRLLCAGRRSRLRHGLRRQALRRLPAPPQRARVPGLGDRPGHGGPHRLAARGPGLGRGRAREGRDLLLHAGAGRCRMSERTILLVEDNPDDDGLTLRALRKTRLRCQLDVAADGWDALDYLRGPRALPAFVLLDLHLPRLSGHEVLERIRKDPRTRLLPVVVLTSSREKEDLERCYGLGANS